MGQWVRILPFNLLSPSRNRKSRLFSLRITFKAKRRDNMTLVAKNVDAEVYKKLFCSRPINQIKKIIRITGPRCPEGSRKLRYPDYATMAQDGGKVVSLKHRLLLPPGNTPSTHFCYRLSRPQGHSAIGWIISMKNSNDTIWKRTSDLPICSAAP